MGRIGQALDDLIDLADNLFKNFQAPLGSWSAGSRRSP